MSFTFKLNKKSVENLDKSIRDAFNKVIKSNAMLNEIGSEIVFDIKDQTQSKAKSIPNKERLKPLTKAWIKRKEFLSRFNQTDPQYQLGKSNLTFTGQLLRSLTHKIVGTGKVDVFFDGEHDPYVNADGESIGDSVGNQIIADGLAERGRPIVGIRKLTARKITRIVRTYVRRALNVAKLLK